MQKLQKSIDKRNALLKATLYLINKDGIQGASVAKVAKLAKVSPATIYLYFENKQDLVNHLYLNVKKEFSERIFENYEDEMPVKHSFKKIWFQMADYKLKRKEEASFLSQCDNTPMIDEDSRQEGLKFIQPLFELWKRGQDENIIKNISPFLLYAFTIYPMAFLMNMQDREIFKLDDTIITEAFKAAWDSIKI